MQQIRSYRGDCYPMVEFGHIENFLTPEECEWFTWYWKLLPTKIDTGQRLRSPVHFNEPILHRIKEKLTEKVKQNNPREEITTVNLNYDYAPGGIHSDGYIDYDKNDTMGHTYFIPLEMDQDYCTVIFDQTSDKAISFNSILGLGNKGLVTYPQVSREEFELDNTPFNEEVYQQYLTHLDYDSLRGLTVKDIVYWKEPGTANIWPRRNLHCSGNFSNAKQRNTILIATKIC